MSDTGRQAAPLTSETVESWLQSCDAKAPQPMAVAMAAATARVPKLGELFAAGRGASGVISNAQLAAKGARDSILANSRALKERIAADDYEGGLQLYREQPIDGCTSIMNIARVAADFNPLQPDHHGNVERFKDYTARLASAPFFNLGLSDTQVQNRESEDWDDLIDSMVETFEGVEASDKARIRQGLTSLAQAAGSRSETKNTETLFVQNVLQTTGPRIDVMIYYSKVEMEESKRKGATSKQTTFTVSRSNLIFRTADWPHFAEKVWQRQITAVDDWLDGNTTKQGDQPTDLCV